MLSPWHWISSVCKQKRILLLLCTFVSSFIAFNYSLLSSISLSPTAVSHHTVTPIISKNEDNFISKPQKHDELVIQANKRQLLALSTVHLPDQQNLSSLNVGEAGVGESDKVSGERMVMRKNIIRNYTLQNTSTKVNNDEGKNVIFPSAIQHSKKENSRVEGKRSMKTSHNNIYAKTEENNVMIASESSLSLSFLVESITTRSIRSSRATSTTSANTNVELSSSIPLIFSSNQLSSSNAPSLESPLPETSQNDRESGTTSHKIGFSSNINNKNDFPSFLRKSNLPSPFHIPLCNTPTQLRRVQKRKKNLTVIENFIMGWNHVKCNETITYTTHGDYRYLDNLVPLVERWDGPVSLAIYAPGTDLDETLKIISFLKQCTSSKIDEWVTFHLIYDIKFSQKPASQNNGKQWDIPWLDDLYSGGKWKNCSEKPTFSKGDYTFRIRNGLLYPINIARNIARSAATTYFVLASDIELYPSINLIPSFMKMLRKLQKEEEKRTSDFEKLKSKLSAAAAAVVGKIFSPSSTITINNDDSKSNENAIEEKYATPLFSSSSSAQPKLQQRWLSDQQHQHNQARHVFVLPVFEVKKEIIPCQVETKEQLIALLNKKSAVLFHHSICPQCHTFPKYEEWKTSVPLHDGTISSGKEKVYSDCNRNGNGSVTTSKRVIAPLKIFHKAKRKSPFQLWEPIFIGTKDEPIYDERLSWEGLRDKMVSGYVMCALDYDFYILENAFLVHKPGIRRVVHLVTKTVQSQDRLINYRIRSELLKKFGRHEECAL